MRTDTYRDRFARLSAGFAVALGAASCGSTDPSTSTVQGVTESDPTQGQSATLLSYWTEPGDVECLQSLIQVNKERHPKDSIVLDPVPSYDLASEVLPKRIASGNTPDLVMVHSENVAAYLQAHGPDSLHSLNDFLALPAQEDVRPNIYSELMADVTHDGNTYAIPVVMSRYNSLYYNKHVFRAHNLQPPTSVAELRTVCQSLESADVQCLGYWIPTMPLVAVLAAAMGVDAFASYASGGETDETALRNAIDLLEEVVDNYVDPASFQGISASELYDKKFVTGEVAMVLDGSWAMGPLQQLGWTAGIDFGVTVPPGSAGLFVYSQDMFAIPAGAPHLQGALNLLDSTASVDGVTATSSFKDSIPTRKDAVLTDANPELLGLIRDMQEAKHRIPAGDYGLMAVSEAVAAFANSSPHDTEALLEVLLAGH
ncbi:ABC transporter substrate-binding protein [Myxococcota bacterium]